MLAYSQDDDPGMTLLSLDDYNNQQNISGSILGSSSSGAPSCGALANDDVFYQFNATTQGAKLTLSSADFDGVLEIWDELQNSVACVNNVNGIGNETNFFSTLVPGQNYYIRIYSADGVQGAGNFNLEYCYLPSLPLGANYHNTSFDGDFYRLDDQIRRSINSDIPVEQTIWKFRNLTNNLEVTYNVNSNLYLTFLDNVENTVGTIANPFFCYGDSVAVSTNLVIEGQNCGYSQEHTIYFQEQPNTWMLPQFVGGTFLPGDFVRAKFTHHDEQFEWELWEFGNLLSNVVLPQGQDLITFDYFEGLLYNRFYEIRVRVTSCGETGPWSPYYPVFIDDVPYTQPWASICNSQINTESVLWCNLVPLATSYYWQITPIALDDPTFTPIAPAQVVESSNAVNLSFFSLSAGQAYRVGVKPIIANGLQIGDYGYFCQIGTAGSGVGLSEEDETNNVTQNYSWNVANALESTTISKIPNTINFTYIPEQQNLKASVGESEIATMVLYSPSGTLIFRQEFEADIDLDLKDFNLSTGVYLCKIISTNKTFQQRFVFGF